MVATSSPLHLFPLHIHSTPTSAPPLQHLLASQHQKYHSNCTRRRRPLCVARGARRSARGRRRPGAGGTVVGAGRVSPAPPSPAYPAPLPSKGFSSGFLLPPRPSRWRPSSPGLPQQKRPPEDLVLTRPLAQASHYVGGVPRTLRRVLGRRRWGRWRVRRPEGGGREGWGK